MDIGNSRVKAAVFRESAIEEKWEVSLGELANLIDQAMTLHRPERAIVSTVSVSGEELDLLFADKCDYVLFHAGIPLPVTIEYKTPETLGADRLAGIMAVYGEYPGKNVLVIDMGSCITYDMLTADNRYFGGAISPGKQMRFKSVNAFTKNLPLVDVDTVPNLVGQSTRASIASGVIHGIIFELDGVINTYSQRFGNLLVIATGGDIDFFVKEVKNTIFADPDLILKGLNKILNHYQANK